MNTVSPTSGYYRGREAKGGAARAVGPAEAESASRRTEGVASTFFTVMCNNLKNCQFGDGCHYAHTYWEKWYGHWRNLQPWQQKRYKSAVCDKWANAIAAAKEGKFLVGCTEREQCFYAHSTNPPAEGSPEQRALIAKALSDCKQSGAVARYHRVVAAFAKSAAEKARRMEQSDVERAAPAAKAPARSGLQTRTGSGAAERGVLPVEGAPGAAAQAPAKSKMRFESGPEARLRVEAPPVEAAPAQSGQRVDYWVEELPAVQAPLEAPTQVVSEAPRRPAEEGRDPSFEESVLRMAGVDAFPPTAEEALEEAFFEGVVRIATE